MRFMREIACSCAIVGACLAFPATANAQDHALPANISHTGQPGRISHCVSGRGVEHSINADDTGCRALTDTTGRAHALALDGIGYAMAASGADAFGVGVAGGIGVSEAVGGLPVAFAVGPDALALTSLLPASEPTETVDAAAPNRAPAVTVAISDSQAQVLGARGSVDCAGPGALAWNGATGAYCLSLAGHEWSGAPAPQSVGTPPGAEPGTR